MSTDTVGEAGAGGNGLPACSKTAIGQLTSCLQLHKSPVNWIKWYAAADEHTAVLLANAVTEHLIAGYCCPCALSAAQSQLTTMQHGQA